MNILTGKPQGIMGGIQVAINFSAYPGLLGIVRKRIILTILIKED